MDGMALAQNRVAARDHREEKAKRVLEELARAGNKNAHEAIYKLQGWQNRRGAFFGLSSCHEPAFTDLLMKLQIKELSELARMGVEPARKMLEEVRTVRGVRPDHVKDLLDEAYHKIMATLRKAFVPVLHEVES